MGLGRGQLRVESRPDEQSSLQTPAHVLIEIAKPVARAARKCRPAPSWCHEAERAHERRRAWTSGRCVTSPIASWRGRGAPLLRTCPMSSSARPSYRARRPRLQARRFREGATQVRNSRLRSAVCKWQFGRRQPQRRDHERVLSRNGLQEVRSRLLGQRSPSSSASAARRCARTRSAALMPSRTAVRTTGWMNSSGSRVEQVGRYQRARRAQSRRRFQVGQHRRQRQLVSIAEVAAARRSCAASTGKRARRVAIPRAMACGPSSITYDA